MSGPSDYPAGARPPRPYRLVPLDAWGSDWTPPAEVPLQPGVDTETPVPRQVLAMSPETFFARLNALLPANPPYPADTPSDGADRPAGHRPRPSSSPGQVSNRACRKPSAQGVEAAKQAIRAQEAHLGEHVNGWQMALDLGRYGTKYAYRAAWTFFGVGGNLIEDACYPLAVTDGHGDPLDSSHRHRLHFDTEQIPPVNAFWSLTMYDPDSYLVANAANRYALGDRSGLTYDEDGSLTLYIQSDEPAASMKANWLPAPSQGGFKVALRLYSPKPEVAQGTWQPPPIEPAD